MTSQITCLKRNSALLFGIVLLTHSHTVFSEVAVNALPTGGQVVAGQATISQTSTATAATMNINQTSQRAVVNWDSFNVGKNATVNFNQPNAQAVTLNRVTGANQSVINGAVRANGQVVLVNPNGVTFGRGAEVNAAAVVATTMNISNKDFMDGKSTYRGNGQGAVINEGKIIANDPNGYVALLAPEVRNEGFILANKGSGSAVVMAAGEQITLNFLGSQLVGVKVDVGTYKGLIENKRVVEVSGGLVVIAAGSANKLMASVIKNTGRISAGSAVNNGGVIEFVAATVTQAGTVSANSKTAQGGQINLVGENITLASGSKTSATGATGGGQVNIGLAATAVSGNAVVAAQVKTAQAVIAQETAAKEQLNQANPANLTQKQVKAAADIAYANGQLAKTVSIEAGATVNTSATQSGNGGLIAIWSDITTTVAGTLKSLGGAIAGNGGFIETSSRGAVQLQPTFVVNTAAQASSGKSGTWLLDPIDLLINSSAANVISAALTNNNVIIEVNANTNTCPSIGSCTQNGSGNLTIESGANILKQGLTATSLTLSASGNFILNADISGENLSVIINSSIAFLNSGTSITANQVTVQAQTIHAYGNINTTKTGTLGAAIELLGQAIYVSGRLSAASSGSSGSLGSTNSSSTIRLVANQITLNSGALLDASGAEGGQITVAANDSIWNSAVIQANGSNGRGGTIALTAANDLHFNNATLVANGSDGGVIHLIANTGDLILQNSLIQTNGSTGRGGSIGISAANNTDIANTHISARGCSQGGSILIGNDAQNGTLPFSIYTSIDSFSSISANQLDPSDSNQAGGFIETSGQTVIIPFLT